MHPTQTLLGQVSAIIAILQAVPYVISMLRGRTKPSRASYGIWSLIGMIRLTSYLAAGATTTKWTIIVLEINAVIFFGLSLKYGMGGRNKFDIPCLALAGLAIVLWIITDNPAFAVYLGVLAGFIGYLPTIRKVYLWPNTENTLSWGMYMVAAILNVCALTTLRPAIALPPLSGLGLSLIVTSLLVFPRWKFKNISQKYRLPKPQEL